MEAAVPANEATYTKGFEFSPDARAYRDLNFTYDVTCQIYGKQKEDQKPLAANIGLLLQKNEVLRVAYIDELETLAAGKVNKEMLVKGDINGKDKIYMISTLSYDWKWLLEMKVFDDSLSSQRER